MEQDNKLDETAMKLNVHLAECALRYENISDSLVKGAKKMDRIQWFLVILAGAILLGPGFAAELLKKFLGN